MIKANAKMIPKGQPVAAERRNNSRISVKTVINAQLLDPLSKTYVPFKAMVVNISKSGIQLAMKKSWLQVEEGTKIMVQPSSQSEITSKSREVVVIWCKEQGDYMTFGCAYI